MEVDKNQSSVSFSDVSRLLINIGLEQNRFFVMVIQVCAFTVHIIKTLLFLSAMDDCTGTLRQGSLPVVETGMDLASRLLLPCPGMSHCILAKPLGLDA